MKIQISNDETIDKLGTMDMAPFVLVVCLVVVRLVEGPVYLVVRLVVVCPGFLPVTAVMVYCVVLRLVVRLVVRLDVVRMGRLSR